MRTVDAERGPSILINRDDKTECHLGNDLRFWRKFFFEKNTLPGCHIFKTIPQRTPMV